MLMRFTYVVTDVHVDEENYINDICELSAYWCACKSAQCKSISVTFDQFNAIYKY